MNGAVNGDDLGALLNAFGHTSIIIKTPIERAADAVNEFAADLYQTLQQEQGNVVFSPLSVATALSMAYAGAAGGHPYGGP